MKPILLLILFLPVVSLAQSGKNHKTTDSLTAHGWETVKRKFFSVQYPSGWTLNESGALGTTFILSSPKESDEDKFNENVTLIIQDLKGMGMDLDKYTKISEEQVNTLITNSKLIESTRIKDAGTEYHKIIYNGDQGIYRLAYEQYYWVKNERAYVLTFVTEQNKFDEYKAIGEQILNSFSFTK